MNREDLGDLLNLLAIAQEGSFTRAAKRLGVSQTALSHAMRRFEARLGIRLLNRTTRSVSPTEVGERLIALAGPSLTEVADGLQAARSTGERITGRLRIAANDHATRRFLWPALSGILLDHPDVRIEVDVTRRTPDLVQERYDAGVGLGSQIERDMIAIPIGPSIRLIVVAAPTYLAHAGLPIPRTPDDLVHHRCVGYRRLATGELSVWRFRRDGEERRFRPDGAIVFNDPALLIEAALAGHGLAFVIEDQAHSAVASGRLLRFLDEWCPPIDPYHLYYPSRRQNSPLFNLLVSRVRYRSGSIPPQLRPG